MTKMSRKFNQRKQYTTLQHSTVTTNLHGSFPYQTIHHSSKNNADTIITCCCFNSRSLVSKLSTFQSFVFSTGYDLICVTETWLSDHIFDQEIIPSQYSIYCNDCTTRGGGVMIAIKDTIPVTRFSSSQIWLSLSTLFFYSLIPLFLSYYSPIIHTNIPLQITNIYFCFQA